MSGHRPFSELIKDFSPERKRRNNIGSQRLALKVQIAQTIGEELLRENEDLSELLCEAELDFSDKELLKAIANQVASVNGTKREFSQSKLQRLEELTGEVCRWIELAESAKV